MEFPLAVLDDIAEEAEDNGVQRGKADAADDAAEDNPVEIERIEQINQMTDKADTDANDRASCP